MNAQFISGLNQIIDFVFSILSQVANLISNNLLLITPIALLLLRKVVKMLNLFKG